MIVVAITGASGYIGSNLIAELLRIGEYEVRVLSRRMQQDRVESKFDSRVQVVEGDINDLSSLQLLLKPGCIVINLVYLWGAGEAENLAVTNHWQSCTPQANDSLQPNFPPRLPPIDKPG